jgi:hypothetical protein
MINVCSSYYLGLLDIGGTNCIIDSKYTLWQTEFNYSSSILPKDIVSSCRVALVPDLEVHAGIEMNVQQVTKHLARGDQIATQSKAEHYQIVFHKLFTKV